MQIVGVRIESVVSAQDSGPCARTVIIYWRVVAGCRSTTVVNTSESQYMNKLRLNEYVDSGQASKCMDKRHSLCGGSATGPGFKIFESTFIAVLARST